MKELKKPRTLWLTNKQWIALKKIAEEKEFKGKGCRERLIEEIVTNPFVIIKGNCKVIIEPHSFS